MIHFHTPWKRKRTRVFRRFIDETLAKNGLSETDTWFDIFIIYHKRALFGVDDRKKVAVCSVLLGVFREETVMKTSDENLQACKFI